MHKALNKGPYFISNLKPAIQSTMIASPGELRLLWVRLVFHAYPWLRCWPTWTRSTRKMVLQGKCSFCSEEMYSGQTKITHVHSSIQVGERYITGPVPNGYHVYVFCFHSQSFFHF